MVLNHYSVFKLIKVFLNCYSVAESRSELAIHFDLDSVRVDRTFKFASITLVVVFVPGSTPL